MIAKITILVFLTVILASCATKKAITILPEKTVNSSYEKIEKTVIKDTVVTFNIDRVVQINEAMFSSFLENQYVKSTAIVDSITGLLHHTLEQKQKTIEIPVRVPCSEVYERNDSIITVYYPVATTTYINKLNDWQYAIMAVGCGSIIAWVLFVVIKIRGKIL